MTEREPKDYHLARRAYEAFFDEQPQVWFENLGHDYQMKWVRAARAVQEDLRRAPSAKRVPNPTEHGDQEATKRLEILASLPRTKTGRIDWRAIKNKEALSRAKQAYQYLWARNLLPRK